MNLKAPKTFNEKILWKKIYDRNPLLSLTADKYGVRDYIRQRLGSARAEQILIPLLHVSKSPDDIPFSRLPENYVAKANQGSGWNVIVKDGYPTSNEVRTLIDAWLRAPYGLSKLEWAYQDIPRRVVFEEFLTDEDGKAPKDYKFFMFHGQCRMILVDSDRFGQHTRTLYTPEWQKLEVTLRFPGGSAVDKPGNLDRMIRLAEELSAEFDFVRVDLYSVRDRIYFGELTHYPGSGMSAFVPNQFDHELGSYWNLKKS